MLVDPRYLLALREILVLATCQGFHSLAQFRVLFCSFSGAEMALPGTTKDPPVQSDDRKVKSCAIAGD